MARPPAPRYEWADLQPSQADDAADLGRKLDGLNRVLKVKLVHLASLTTQRRAQRGAGGHPPCAEAPAEAGRTPAAFKALNGRAALQPIAHAGFRTPVTHRLPAPGLTLDGGSNLPGECWSADIPSQFPTASGRVRAERAGARAAAPQAQRSQPAAAQASYQPLQFQQGAAPAAGAAAGPHGRSQSAPEARQPPGKGQLGLGRLRAAPAHLHASLPALKAAASRSPAAPPGAVPCGEAGALAASCKRRRSRLSNAAAPRLDVSVASAPASEEQAAPGSNSSSDQAPAREASPARRRKRARQPLKAAYGEGSEGAAAAAPLRLSGSSKQSEPLQSHASGICPLAVVSHGSAGRRSASAAAEAAQTPSGAQAGGLQSRAGSAAEAEPGPDSAEASPEIGLGPSDETPADLLDEAFIVEPPPGLGVAQAMPDSGPCEQPLAPTPPEPGEAAAASQPESQEGGRCSRGVVRGPGGETCMVADTQTDSQSRSPLTGEPGGLSSPARLLACGETVVQDTPASEAAPSPQAAPAADCAVHLQLAGERSQAQAAGCLLQCAGGVQAAAVSPCGRFLGLCTSEASEAGCVQLQLWQLPDAGGFSCPPACLLDASMPAEQGSLQQHSPAFVPGSGEQAPALAALCGRSVRLWDAAQPLEPNATQPRELLLPFAPRCLAAAAAPGHLLVGGEGAAVACVDAATGCVSLFQAERPSDEGGPPATLPAVTGFAASAEAGTAALLADGSLAMLDCERQRVLRPCKHAPAAICAAAAVGGCSKGSALPVAVLAAAEVSASSSGRLHAGALSSAGLRLSPPVCEQAFVSLVAHGDLLAAATSDGLMCVWNLCQAEPLAVVEQLRGERVLCLGLRSASKAGGAVLTAVAACGRVLCLML